MSFTDENKMLNLSLMEQENIILYIFSLYTYSFTIQNTNI